MSGWVAVMLVLMVGIGLFLIWLSSGQNEGIDSNLLQACKGDKALAKRLLQQAQLRYPDKSERWYVEKVIYDLERDRSGGRRQPLMLSSGEMREKLLMIGAFAWIASMLSSIFRR